jgi:hypothetical protein
MSISIVLAPWRRLILGSSRVSLALLGFCLSLVFVGVLPAQDVYFNQVGPVDWNASDGMWQDGAGTLYVVPAINAPASGGFAGYGDVNAQINNGGTVEITTPTQPVTWAFVNSANNTWTAQQPAQIQPPDVGTDSTLFIHPGGTLRAAGGNAANAHNEFRIGAWAGPHKGVVFQLGGDVFAEDEIGIGIQGGARGEYNLADGTAISDSEFRLGTDAGSQGVMNQIGGRAEFGRTRGEGLNVGLNGDGVYNIDGPTSVLFQNQSATDWGGGNGDAAWNFIGHNATGRGEMNISNGAEVRLMGRTHVGFSNQTGDATGTRGGFVNQTGGVFEVRNHELIIGDGDDGNGNAAAAGGRGEYHISGGELTTRFDTVVGHWTGSNALLDISGNADVNVGQHLRVGNLDGYGGVKPATGRLELSDTATVNVQGQLLIGMDEAAVGDVNQDGATLDTIGNATVANLGTARYEHTGGVDRIGGNMTIAAGGGSNGLYHLGGTGTLDMTGGNISIGGGTGAFVFDGGALHDAANVNFSLANLGGEVQPGAAAGVTTVHGDYVQSVPGSYQTQIGGLAAGTEYDVLDIMGLATLSGTLNVDLIGGFAPVIGNEFTVLRGNGGVAGVFTNLDFTDAPLGAGSWMVDYQPDRVILRVVPEPATLGLAAVAAIAGAAAVWRRRRR